MFTWENGQLNIIICGIGGQGNVVTSDVFASALVEEGYWVSVGEVYGMAQRGGSVISHIRISEDMQYGPLIPYGEADIIVGFEPVETLRVARSYANNTTIVIFDPHPSYPVSVLAGKASYPTIMEIFNELKCRCRKVFQVEAGSLTKEAGLAQSANILLMGMLTALPQVPLTDDAFIRSMQRRFAGKVFEENRRAFSLGYSYGKQSFAI